MLTSLADQLAADLDVLRSCNRFRSCQTLDGPSGVTIQLEGRALISFCSNDYLGLASHQWVRAAATQAIQNHGFGAGASRLVSGTHSTHAALENAIAAFLGMPSALLFPTGYQANLGLLSALAGPDDLIVVDRAVHASILDGCRLSRAKLAIYPHLDASTAERHLSRLGPGKRRRFLVTESLFSMDGDVAPLSTLASIAQSHDAALVVDEAHAIGILGANGRGLCAQHKVQPDILVGTFGKALGSCGAFVAGSSALRDYLVNHSRTFIFTTALPIPVVAASLASLHLSSTPEGDHLRDQLHRRTKQLRSALNLPTTQTSSPILPIIIGPDHLALAASNQLRSMGFFIQAIRPPTVPEGSSRLRVTLSAQHTEHQVLQLAEALREIEGMAPFNSTLRRSPTTPYENLPFRQSAQRTRRPSIPGIILLGTDTGVGKTSVAVALLHSLAVRGLKPVPFKPVETGAIPMPSDAIRLTAACLRNDIPLGVVCPITYADPVAPAVASANHPLNLSVILEHAYTAATYGSPMVVESAGGVLTPYATNLTSLDLAVALGFPVLLVARNGLGTINHTALALSELRRRGAQLLGTILVTTTNVRTPDQDTNLSMIHYVTGEAPMGILPFCESKTPESLSAALATCADLTPIFDRLST